MNTMMRRLTIGTLALAVLGLGDVTTEKAHAQMPPPPPPDYGRPPMPPPRYEIVPAPRPHWAWMPGRWIWAPRGYVWHPGHWRPVGGYYRRPY